MAEIDSRKASLIAEIEVSRFEIRSAVRQCEANLNPVAVLRRSVVNNSAAWLSSAALLGLVVSRIVCRGRRSSSFGDPGASQEGWETTRPGSHAGTRPRARSWVVSLGGLAYDLLKPALIDWATAMLTSLARNTRITGHQQKRNGVSHDDGKRPHQPR
jgi:hypothetical protein